MIVRLLRFLHPRARTCYRSAYGLPVEGPDPREIAVLEHLARLRQTRAAQTRDRA